MSYDIIKLEWEFDDPDYFAEVGSYDANIIKMKHRWEWDISGGGIEGESGRGYADTVSEAQNAVQEAFEEDVLRYLVEIKEKVV